MPELVIGEDEQSCSLRPQRRDRIWATTREDLTHPSEWIESHEPLIPRMVAESMGPPLRVVHDEDTLESAIERSRAMTGLPPDWDDDGAQPISLETWETAVMLLRRLVRVYERCYAAPLPVPTFGPCSDGSIDLHWRTASCHVLVNVQPAGAPCDFYGEAGSGQVQGKFAPGDSSSEMALCSCLAGVARIELRG